ncbi:MAG: peptidoglycan DD-metalloendopeptidase family protein [Oscillospiraceae bacterium]|nr:peptidoglycan DD-metalloendopeptidase family protein [Oscillospiraceae bacterium]
MLFSRKKKLFCGILSLVLILSAFPIGAQAVSEEELDVLKAERDALVRQRQTQQKLVNELREQQAGVLEVKQALDERNTFTIWQLELTRQEIELYNHMIAEKNMEVEEALRLETEQLERYRVRVRAMEENGNTGFLDLLLNTSDLGEFLTAMDDMGEIMESDRALEDAYIAARMNTEKVRAEYEDYKISVELIQADLQAQQAELEAELEEANQLINQITADIESNAAILEEFAAAERQAETNVANMVIALEKERKAKEAAMVKGTGSFIWPAPTSTYLTSRFGLRVHPVTGVQKSHTGIDIGAGAGDNALAADGGTVTMAGWNGGYGNCVMIDHGNGYKTLYAHLSSISVAKGAVVDKGAVVGYVGSTGVSTGPHLHFEVWSGESRIDPEQFYSGLTFSPNAGV